MSHWQTPRHNSNEFLSTDGSGSGTAMPYSPRFERETWRVSDPSLSRFFDRFVPTQYEQGFAWRCRCIGGNEVQRTTPFEEQSETVQKIIANNAEVLLQLYTGTPPQNLDMMRDAGKQILTHGLVNPSEEHAWDLPELRVEMASRHHATWRIQALKDIAAGRRSDPDHRGIAENIHDLPDVEQKILKVQTWGNWRILAQLSDEDYAIIRGAAAETSQNT
jgi:hypothetical protein